jgi:hypothetical protein
VITGHPVHALRSQARPSQNIAATDDQTKLHTLINNGIYFAGEPLNHIRINPVCALSHQRLTAKL